MGTNEDANSSFCEDNKRNSFYLNGQEEVEAFGARGCEVIHGVIHISDSEDSRVTDLSSLSNLRTIEGLSIENTTSLTSLRGLENVTRIKKNLYNDLLTRGYLRISNNNELSDISALNNIELIEGELMIAGNEKLTSINALASLEDTYEGVAIFNNSALVEIGGLNSLGSINGHLEIHDNPSLTSITGLTNLKWITFNQYGLSLTPKVKILDNAMLTNFCGLRALAHSAIHSDLLDVDFEVERNKYNPSVGYISSEADCFN